MFLRQVEKVTVDFDLSYNKDFGFYDESGMFTVEKGDFKFFVG